MTGSIYYNIRTIIVLFNHIRIKIEKSQIFWFVLNYYSVNDFSIKYNLSNIALSPTDYSLKYLSRVFKAFFVDHLKWNCEGFEGDRVKMRDVGFNY